jgi:hypothetical protein
LKRSTQKNIFPRRLKYVNDVGQFMMRNFVICKLMEPWRFRYVGNLGMLGKTNNACKILMGKRGKLQLGRSRLWEIDTGWMLEA